MSLAEPIQVALRVGQVLDELQVSWLVGGSVASSLYGIPRATQDIDLVAAIHLRQVRPLVAALEEDFYADEDCIRAAVRSRSSFNLIHLGTMTKIDVFAPRGDRLSRLQLSRRQRFPVGDPDGRELALASPEDVVLQKLDWYRAGGCSSERQWRDVLGVLRVRGSKLDWTYMEELAQEAGLDALLLEAREG